MNRSQVVFISVLLEVVIKLPQPSFFFISLLLEPAELYEDRERKSHTYTY